MPSSASQFVALALALMCGPTLGGGLRKLNQMELATDSLPVASTSTPVPAAEEAAPTAPLAPATPSAAIPVPAAPAPPSLLAAIETPSTVKTPSEEWAESIAKKTTDEALLTMFDIAAQIKAVYKTFDLNANGVVEASEVATVTQPAAASRRQLQMELASDPLPEQVAQVAELPPAEVAALASGAPLPPTAVLADTPLPASIPAAPALAAAATPVAAAAPAIAVPAAVPAAPVYAAAAPVAAAPAVAVPAAVPAAPVYAAAAPVAAAPAVAAAPVAAAPVPVVQPIGLTAASPAQAKLTALFELVEKLNVVHGIFDADSDGVVSAADLIKIAKGPSA